MALRICIDCGLEVRTKDELENFTKKRDAKYGRRNLCKKCCNSRLRHRILTDDRVYLLRKLDNMKRRCYYPNVEAYPLYGGRGIIICQEWLDDPDAFVKWSLDSGFHRDLQIDRIDNDGGYSPDNCRWVTSRVQNRNTRGNSTDFEKGTRVCGRCKVEKSLEEFHRAKGNPAGRMYVCKECRIV